MTIFVYWLHFSVLSDRLRKSVSGKCRRKKYVFRSLSWLVMCCYSSFPFPTEYFKKVFPPQKRGIFILRVTGGFRSLRWATKDFVFGALPCGSIETAVSPYRTAFYLLYLTGALPPYPHKLLWTKVWQKTSFSIIITNIYFPRKDWI